MKKIRIIVILINLCFVLAGCGKKADPKPSQITAQECILLKTIINDTLTSTHVYNSDNRITSINYSSSTGNNFSTTIQYDAQHRVIAILGGATNSYYTYNDTYDGKLSLRISVQANERDSILYHWLDPLTIKMVTYKIINGLPYDTLKSTTVFDIRGNVSKVYTTVFRDPLQGAGYPGNRDTLLLTYEAIYSFSPEFYPPNLDVSPVFPNQEILINVPQSDQYYSYSYSDNQVIKSTSLSTTYTCLFDSDGDITGTTENVSAPGNSFENVIKYTYSCKGVLINAYSK